MAGQGSARVTLREIDLSQVRNPQQSPQGVPAAVVGTARKGPAFVPRTFANMQQFNEVFGSMLEVGRDTNSNLPGPLALNEWMKSAQAGTFLRVLGVGDGKKANTVASTLNKVTDAGFVVGSKQVQAKSGTDSEGKLGNNPHATIGSGNESRASQRAKTHFLGCFMKDAANSSFLKDSGIEIDSSGSVLTIKLKNSSRFTNNDTLKLTFFNNAGDAASTDSVTFTFLDAHAAQAEGAADTNIANGIASNLILQDLANAINGLADVKDHLNAAVTGTATDPVLTITSVHGVLGEVTNNAKAEFDVKASTGTVTDIDIGGKTASEAFQTVNFDSAGNTSANFKVKLTDNPADAGTLAFNLINNDGQGNLTNKLVTYTFKDVQTVVGSALGGSGAARAANFSDGVFTVTATNAVDIQKGTTKEETLKNLKSALDRIASSAGNATNHQGLSITSYDELTNTLTISQKVQGDDGNSLANGADANITALTATNTTITVASSLANARSSTTLEKNSGNFAASFMFGGVDSDEKKNLTISLTGNAVEDDKINISVQKVADVDGRDTAHFIFKAAANNGGTDGSSGSPYQVQIGADLQETLYNLKNAIGVAHVGANANISDDVTAVVSDANDSITITYKNNDAANLSIANKQGGARGNMDCRVEVGSYATFTNTNGFSLVGNHGQKTSNFSGAGQTAKPIIRGVLMVPQGIKPSMDAPDLNGIFVSGTDIDSTTEISNNIRSLDIGSITEKTFGNTNGDNLAGYLVGEVDSNQSFKLILNGFSNSEHPAVVDCSFDPDNDSYFAKVLNTDPTKIEEKGHYLYAHWDIDKNVAAPSNAGLLHAGGQLAGSYAKMIGFVLQGEGDGSSLPDYDSFEQRFQTAKTPWIVSQFASTNSNTSARPASAAAGGAKKLFRLYSLDDGEVGNTQFRLLISDLRYGGENEYGTFTLSLEKFDSDPIKGETLISWKKADLNPDSPNFIGRLIGDEHEYYDFDLDEDKQRIKTKGSYSLKNNYVRIELSDELKQGLVPPSALPTGFQGHSYIQTALEGNFLEQANLTTNRVFTNSLNNPLTTLAGAQVLPLDFVKSISRIVSGSTEEADSDLAWGVKLSVRENKDSDKKELVEQVFNHSIKSWSKFFPSIGQHPVMNLDGDSADGFQNSFFSLEKIQLGDDTSSAVWNGSKYIRKSAAPESGKRFVTISQDAKGGNVKYLKFRCLFQGGFDGVNIFDQEKADLTSVAAVREGQDETGLKKFTGPTIMSYQRAIDVLADKSAAEFQLLSVPGQRASQITDYAIDACEDRFDALLVMDIVEKTAEAHHVELTSEKPHVRNTISSFENRSLDTSFAAAYFPDIVIRRPSDSAPVIMPPSVGIMGVMSRNDSIADPWFAPAGLSRGRLGAIDAQVQMNRDLLDELYDADINPVYVPAGRSEEVYAFGQKTLLQDASALDRINVRRLLIDIRRKVKKVGEQLLFEPNRASTLAKFSALVEPIMANVQQRRGVERYKVQIDTTTTTQNDVENNTIRGKIYLQPTKSVEFISLDFVVANNIQ